MVTYLNLGKYGRLGNQLFEIAGTIGMAIKSGHEFGFPQWINHDHATRFHSGEDINVQDYFKNPLPAVVPGEYRVYNIRWGYWNVTVPDGVTIEGHMQSEKYFAHCSGRIRHYFELKKLSDMVIPDNAIAIHVRLGDYDNAYHPRLDMKYYGKALRDFPLNYKWYVFSDDPAIARRMFGCNAEYIEDNHYMVDFYLMTQFKNFIIGNSTYSWWPAWLNGKIVYAPLYWFGPAAKVTAKDIYCDGWIII